MQLQHNIDYYFEDYEENYLLDRINFEGRLRDGYCNVTDKSIIRFISGGLVNTLYRLDRDGCFVSGYIEIVPCKTSKVKSNNKKISKDVVHKVRAMYYSGDRICDIAKMLSISEHSVSHIVHRKRRSKYI